MGEVDAKLAVTWFKPVGKGRTLDYPCVAVNKKSLDFNFLASELLGRPRAVMVGATSDGRLVVKPADEGDTGACKLTYRGRCATINRPRLVRMLARHGVIGKLKLEWNEKLGLFVGDKA